VRTLNAVNLLGLDAADRGQTATEWQRSRYPEAYRDKIVVAHEGIDTDRVKPDPGAVLKLESGLSLTRKDEVVTYVARHLEPYRGFHVLMRALPEIQRRRPKARVVIVGGDDVGYGRDVPEGTTWRGKMLDEVGSRLDASRVHFLGRVPYDTYLKVLQVSSAHVYLTYPFVLSWSILEAMAAGCAVIGSATQPVQEAIRDGENGLLVDFFDSRGIAETVETALAEQREHIRLAARQTVVKCYDLRTVCLPRQVAQVDSMLRTGSGSRRRESGRETFVVEMRPRSEKAAMV
jgi:glycosyltransferase involved in cell wall biosynthesis